MLFSNSLNISWDFLAFSKYFWANFVLNELSVGTSATFFSASRTHFPILSLSSFSQFLQFCDKWSPTTLYEDRIQRARFIFNRAIYNFTNDQHGNHAKFEPINFRSCNQSSFSQSKRENNVSYKNSLAFWYRRQVKVFVENVSTSL